MVTERTQPTLAERRKELARILAEHAMGPNVDPARVVAIHDDYRCADRILALLAPPAEPPTLCISCRTQIAGPAVLYSLCDEPCVPAEPETQEPRDGRVRQW